MLLYKDEQNFINYVNELEKVIEDKKEQYVREHGDPGIYIKEDIIPELNNVQCSDPYYDEINIGLITGCNVSNSRKEIPSNFERVISSIRYILKNECMPIAVIKHKDGFYIENGKHRFYAHVLLKKGTIPVSIREIVDKMQTINKNMITISSPFYNNDGMKIAYPEKAVEFFRQYKQLFKSVKCIEMVSKDDSRNNCLKITLSNCDEINFVGCCTAGSAIKSSQITCDLLNECGYKVDMKFISTHSSFKLEDKRDAHNINFSVGRNMDIINDVLVANIKMKKAYNDNEQMILDFFKLHSYICDYEVFECPCTHFSCYSSSFLKIDNKFYYLVGAENRYSIDSIYIFMDSYFPFNNLTVEFLGVISCKDQLYQKLKS